MPGAKRTGKATGEAPRHRAHPSWGTSHPSQGTQALLATEQAAVAQPPPSNLPQHPQFGSFKTPKSVFCYSEVTE